ncbi:ATP-binding protein [Streptomyces gardneri]|uniref:SARP family transcriptional regulator n=1 Tax=Streptomyces gardneri TaxID=66892 RepID=A0A4Y3RSU4_9ACTN|nr:BTAD domain-containing putative transcriptional regulator [Streptomyces gardneri]GEB60766.1 SARP family transcriptional regulator [Streptomyces gardneri]GHH06479.1 SARP family transcriptional regulator [Streptomyces gardneri]
MIFRLLGPLVVSDPAGAAAPAAGGPKVRALLARLLLDAGRTVPVDRLVDGLYGDEPPAGAQGALQAQVSRLRRVLPPGVAVEHSPAGYRLALGTPAEDVDALRFEALAGAGARALAAGDPVHAADLLREALGLWRGPALSDVRDAPFAAGQAARLEGLRLDALEAWGAAELASGASGEDLSSLVQELAAAVREHPLRERLRGLQMRALGAAGRQAEALAVYEEVRAALAEELGADPSPELSAVHLGLLRGGEAGPGRTGPERVAAPALPAPLTDFVGREREGERLASLVAAARLVTLVGPGGAGKTRLALEVGAALAGEVRFVDLGAVVGGGRTGAGEVAEAFAAALGVRGGGAERLETALAGRPVLLIVDNCEHVVDETAVLVRRLLAACPRLRVLTTSREALGITGESLLPLGALTPEAAEELFVRRAAAVRPGFTGHARVAELCAGLDGLPLAVELAAARLRSLSVDELADGLGERLERFELLSRGDRTAPERHRTLRAVVEWSWSLLAPGERELAARFSVFRGGATAEAVTRVCGAGAGALASLVEKSLVEARDGRYGMLETIRAYAAGQLPEEDPATAAHHTYYRELAEAADPELRGAAQLEWLVRLDAEDANLRAALRRGTPEDALRLVAALTPYWWLRGLRGRVAAPVAELLERVVPTAELGEEYALCVLAAGLREGEHVERAQQFLASRTVPLRQPYTAFLWSTSVGPVEGLPMGDDPWSRSLVLVGRAFLTTATGSTHGDGAQATAEALLTEALAGFRTLGDRWGTATALEGLAALSPEPLPLLAEALALFASLGVAEDVVDLLHRRAAVHEAAGDPDAAAADRTRAADTARKAGLKGTTGTPEVTEETGAAR